MRFILLTVLFIATAHGTTEPTPPTPTVAPAATSVATAVTPETETPAEVATPAENGLAKFQKLLLLREQFKFVYYKENGTSYRGIDDSGYHDENKYEIKISEDKNRIYFTDRYGNIFHIDETTAKILFNLDPTNRAIELKSTPKTSGSSSVSKYISRKNLNSIGGIRLSGPKRVFIDEGSTNPTQPKKKK